MEKRFGSTPPYTVGVEEEFQLVDPFTLELAPAVENVIGAAPGDSERMTRELFQDCVEVRTPVFSDVAGLARRLPEFRLEAAKVADEAGVGIAASGLHPTSDPFAQRFTLGERYERMQEERASSPGCRSSTRSTSTSGCPTEKPPSAPRMRCCATCPS